MAASLTTQCPECRQSFKLPPELSGQRVKCPECATIFKTPETLSESKATRSGSSGSRINESSGEERAGVPVKNSSGTSFGRFELRSVLGQGAFGRVYQAYDRQLDRIVALKVPLFGPDEARKISRFQTEAKAAASLRHPNIVPVLDSGTVDGKLYIATQFVEGKTLSATLSGSSELQIPFEQSARWIKSIAAALAYAHSMGIVHRDVKPQNIILDNRNEPQLMDFGLAKRVNEDAAMTTEGSLLGTPAYMSPEQARGDVAQVGPLSDQYAVGATFYELVTGQRPFEGPPHAVLAMILSTEPVPPRTLRKEITADLEAIILKAMAKDPKERYPDCQALSDDLDCWIRGEPTLARPITSLERLVRWGRKNKTVAALSIGLCVSASIAFLILWISFLVTSAAKRESDTNLIIANERKLAAETAEKKATASANRLQVALTDLTAEKNRVANQREELLSKNYAISMSKVSGYWESSRSPLKIERELRRISNDSALDRLKNIEFYYWNRFVHHYCRSLPGYSSRRWIDPHVTLSLEDQYIIVAERRHVWIWESATGKLLDSLDFDQLKDVIPPDMIVSEARFAGKENGNPTPLLLNCQHKSDPRQFVRITFDMLSKTMVKSTPNSKVEEVQGLGLVELVSEPDKVRYTDFKSGETIVETPPTDVTSFPLKLVDRAKAVALLESDNSLHWRKIGSSDVLHSFKYPFADRYMFAFCQPQANRVFVHCHDQLIALDLPTLQQLEIKSLDKNRNYVTFNPWTKGAIWQNSDESCVYDPDHAARDKLEAPSSDLRLPIPSHLSQSRYRFSQDGKFVVMLPIEDLRIYSSPQQPVICSLTRHETREELRTPGQFVKSSMIHPGIHFSSNTMKAFIASKKEDNSFKVDLVSFLNDTPTIEFSANLSVPGGKIGRKQRWLWQRRELVFVAEDDLSLNFLKLSTGPNSSSDSRRIQLPKKLAGFAFDRNENQIAVSYQLEPQQEIKGKQLPHIPVGRGQVDVFQVQDGKLKSTYHYLAHYAESTPMFDRTGKHVFLGGGHQYFTEFEHIVGFDVETGSVSFQKPIDNLILNEIVVADADARLVARGPFIYRLDSSLLSQTADGSDILSLTSDGTRAFTTTGIADVATGEILMRYPEPDFQFFEFDGSNIWGTKGSEAILRFKMNKEL